jgi:hypothetical protein
MEVVEFYLNKIKKLILLDEIQTVILKQILDDFYREIMMTDARNEAWMEGYLEGKGYKKDKGD